MERVYDITKHGFTRFLQRIDGSVDNEYDMLDRINDAIETGHTLDSKGEHEEQDVVYSEEQNLSVVVDGRVAVTVVRGRWGSA